jgi:hypothetical protein
MKPVTIKVHPEVARLVRGIARAEGISSQSASWIAFFRQEKAPKSMPEYRVRYWKKQTKKNIAMTL